jgi:hypothetical protein
MESSFFKNNHVSDFFASQNSKRKTEFFEVLDLDEKNKKVPPGHHHTRCTGSNLYYIGAD